MSNKRNDPKTEKHALGRQDRLKAALKVNMARRKAQAKVRAGQKAGQKAVTDE